MLKSSARRVNVPYIFQHNDVVFTTIGSNVEIFAVDKSAVITLLASTCNGHALKESSFLTSKLG